MAKLVAEFTCACGDKLTIHYVYYPAEPRLKHALEAFHGDDYATRTRSALVSDGDIAWHATMLVTRIWSQFDSGFQKDCKKFWYNAKEEIGRMVKDGELS